jgi:predicted nucleic acid-binding protein
VKLYADTSFLFSYYSSDANSARADHWRQAHPYPLLFTALHRVELRNALELSVFLKRSSPELAKLAWLTVEADLQAGLLMTADVSFAKLVELAETLALSHTAKLGSRSLDLLHVAVAQALSADEFVTFDQRQANLATHANLNLAML